MGHMRGFFFNPSVKIRSHGELNPGPEECYSSHLTNSNITASHIYFLVCSISEFVDSVKKMLESNKEYTNKHFKGLMVCVMQLANEMIVCTIRGTTRMDFQKLKS
jgi:hypothetical protein